MRKVEDILQSGRAQSAAFLAWWGAELGALLPDALKSLLAGTDKRVRFALSEGGYRVSLEGAPNAGGEVANAVTPDRAHAVAIAVAMAERQGGLGITLVLPQAVCFVRTVEIPRAALKDCRRVLDLDLERATPFRHADVYTSYKVLADTGADHKARVRQYVTKRELVDPVVAEVVNAGGRVVAVDVAAAPAHAPEGINFMAAPDAEGGGLAALTPARALALAAGLLLLLACGQVLYKREAALDEVRAQTATMRKQAAAVRQTLEQSQVAIKDLTALQAIKLKQVPMIAVIEEITRILPDSAWVTDLRIENDLVDVSGLATSGANLLPLFERSPIFGEAALTAPVTFDQREDKERFSLRVRIKSAELRGMGAGG